METGRRKIMKILKRAVCLVILSIMLMGIITGCAYNFSYIYENGDKYTAGDRTISDKIDTINIDYMSGEVKLTGVSGENISIQETANKNLEKKQKVHSWVDGSTLYIRFCASDNNLNFDKIDKKLEVEIPEKNIFKDIKVEISSGEVVCKNIETEKLRAEASSGSLDFDCVAETISMEVSSGGVSLVQKGKADEISLYSSSGTINADVENVSAMNLSASSGSININGVSVKNLNSSSSSGESIFKLKKVPEKTDISASSGDVSIFIPEASDVKADISVSSGDISYELPFSKDGKSYICGNGNNKMNIETSSGDININRLAE